MNLVNTYEKIFETVLHNYTCDDVELNLLQFSSPIGAFIFLILVLQSLYLCGLKRCFAV